MKSQLLLLLLLLVVRWNEAIASNDDILRIATLADHNPNKWEKTAGCGDEGSAERAKCNVGVVYAEAARVAAERSADLLVLPEGYGIVGSPKKDGSGFDAWSSHIVGTTPCGDRRSDDEGRPSVSAISCLAKRNQVAIAANVFTQLSNDTRRISEYVFDKTGAVLATYDKHHLFPVEEPKVFSPGPFAPTAFSFMNRTLGLLICYEGFYPYLTGDFSQTDALVTDMNADGIVWSVGGSGVSSALDLDASLLAKKYDVPVVASEDSEVFRTASVALVAAGGRKVPDCEDAPLSGLSDAGYTAKPFLRIGDVSFAG